MKKILLLAALLAMTACGTKRTITDTQSDTATAAHSAAAAYVRAVRDNNPITSAITAKLSVDLNIGTKNVGLSGSLKMKRDDVIQLSLTLLFVEVARVEFTPRDVLIIDRVHKQYVRASYADVDFLAQAGLDFKALQALFWHELFVPGSDEVRPERFQLSAAGDHTLLTISDAPRLNYEFLCVTKSHLIDRLSVEGKTTAERGKFVWRYADFTTLAGKPFPKKMTLSVAGVGKDITAALQLSGLGTDSAFEGHTTPSSKYRQRQAAEVLKSLF
ncbi:MAG: DUF4292 domain-containing protein [Bacteroidaceae bacterium]|nr:DUF4292 domain-containing protein [Bacteroidaceae bacterium]